MSVNITNQERQQLPIECFAHPMLRLLPIYDQESLNVAVRRLPFIPDREMVRVRIIGLAQAQNLRLPNAWRRELNMSTQNIIADSEDATNQAREYAQERNRERGDKSKDEQRAPQSNETETERDARDQAFEYATRENKARDRE
jgi:hypothetical protein